jgi:hypothetical protein
MVVGPDNGVSWQVLTIIVVSSVTMSVGAIWLGNVTGQVDVNTKRLERIETLLDEIRRHDADTTARETINERRLDRLELNHQPPK